MTKLYHLQKGYIVFVCDYRAVDYQIEKVEMPNQEADMARLKGARVSEKLDMLCHATIRWSGLCGIGR